MVYDLLAIAINGIGPRTSYSAYSKKSECFKIMHLNKQIRNEVQVGYKFFARNNFFIQHVGHMSEFSKAMPISISDHVQELTYVWDGRVKEASWIAYIPKTLPNLKILHILIGYHVAEIHHNPPVSRANKLHQNNVAIAKFSVVPGFDKLVQIRGLHSVTVGSKSPTLYTSNVVHLTATEVQVFEAFLNQELTQQKPNTKVNFSSKSKLDKYIPEIQQLMAT